MPGLGRSTGIERPSFIPVPCRYSSRWDWSKNFSTAGCRQRVIKVHSDGELLGTMDLAGCGSIYGFNVGLSEEVTESILTDYLHQQGGEVNRSSRLIGLTINPDNRVLAEIERDGEPLPGRCPLGSGL